MDNRLTDFLNASYRARVLGEHRANPEQMFSAHAEDADFLDAAKNELERLRSVVETRGRGACFASTQQYDALSAALAGRKDLKNG